MKNAFVMILALALAISLAGCTQASIEATKMPLLADDFRELMEAQALTVENVTDEIHADALDIALMASSDTFSFLFFVLPGAEAAAEGFVNAAGEIQSIDSLVEQSVSRQGENYQYFSRTTGDGYFVVSRIENTLLFVQAELSDKESVIEILKILDQ